MTQKLKGKIALVTGASRGIGAAVAKRYAAEGAELILVARTVGGLEEVDDAVRAAGSKATLVPLDLAEHDQIDNLGATLYQKFGKIDIVVGNAAVIGELAPLSHVSTKLWQSVMDVNVTANWRLIRSLHPLLMQSAAGRGVFVTSAVASHVFPYFGAYAASKSALEMLVNTYALENSKNNINVNLVDPGIVATGMRAQAFPGEDSSELAKPEDITDIFVELALAECQANGELFLAQS